MLRHFLCRLLTDSSSVNVKNESLRYTCWSDVSGCFSGAAPASLCSELGAVSQRTLDTDAHFKVVQCAFDQCQHIYPMLLI